MDLRIVEYHERELQVQPFPPPPAYGFNLDLLILRVSNILSACPCSSLSGEAASGSPN